MDEQCNVLYEGEVCCRLAEGTLLRKHNFEGRTAIQVLVFNTPPIHCRSPCILPKQATLLQLECPLVLLVVGAVLVGS